MKDIEEIAEEHSIQDLGRISPAYQCGFTQGSNYSKKEFIDKAVQWLNNHTNWDDIYIDCEDVALEFRKAMEE